MAFHGIPRIFGNVSLLSPSRWPSAGGTRRPRARTGWWPWQEGACGKMGSEPQESQSSQECKGAEIGKSAAPHWDLLSSCQGRVCPGNTQGDFPCPISILIPTPIWDLPCPITMRDFPCSIPVPAPRGIFPFPFPSRPVEQILGDVTQNLLSGHLRVRPFPGVLPLLRKIQELQSPEIPKKPPGSLSQSLPTGNLGLFPTELGFISVGFGLFPTELGPIHGTGVYPCWIGVY